MGRRWLCHEVVDDTGVWVGATVADALLKHSVRHLQKNRKKWGKGGRNKNDAIDIRLSAFLFSKTKGGARCCACAWDVQWVGASVRVRCGVERVEEEREGTYVEDDEEVGHKTHGLHHGCLSCGAWEPV